MSELTSTNSAVFEMLLDAVHGREDLTPQQIIDLLSRIRTDTSLTSSVPNVFSLQMLSTRLLSAMGGDKIIDPMYLGHRSSAQPISFKLHLRDGQTDGQRDTSRHPSVRPSFS